MNEKITYAVLSLLLLAFIPATIAAVKKTQLFKMVYLRCAFISYSYSLRTAT